MGKKETAELRVQLYEKVGPVEDYARKLLTDINKLRHGDINLIAKIDTMQAMAKQIAKDLKQVQDAL